MHVTWIILQFQKKLVWVALRGRSHSLHSRSIKTLNKHKQELVAV